MMSYTGNQHRNKTSAWSTQCFVAMEKIYKNKLILCSTFSFMLSLEI